jgi:hypothetical protein
MRRRVERLDDVEPLHEYIGHHGQRRRKQDADDSEQHREREQREEKDDRGHIDRKLLDDGLDQIGFGMLDENVHQQRPQRELGTLHQGDEHARDRGKDRARKRDELEESCEDSEHQP